MTNNAENQPQVKIKNNLQNNNSDIISLSQLYEALAHASITLEKILLEVGISMQRMKEAKKLVDIKNEVWQLEHAKEFLDIVIANAALGNPQILTCNGWLVQLTALTNDSINK